MLRTIMYCLGNKLAWLREDTRLKAVFILSFRMRRWFLTGSRRKSINWITIGYNMKSRSISYFCRTNCTAKNRRELIIETSWIPSTVTRVSDELNEHFIGKANSQMKQIFRPTGSNVILTDPADKKWDAKLLSSLSRTTHRVKSRCMGIWEMS